ncbi:MAG: OmpH family outer membrane protein [Treponema sp.]|nr:OmpH family outer membrane protein [Treponema sp.]
MVKKFLVLLMLGFIFTGSVFGQHISRIAVVDLPKVYTEFFRESQAVRNFETRAANVQRDIERMQTDIRNLNSRLATAIANDDQREMIRLETEINTRNENLRVFFQARTAELDAERKRLMESGSFLSQVHDEIRYIAESEGFTHVFDIKNTPGLVWFANSTDITERLLNSLRTRRAR